MVKSDPFLDQTPAAPPPVPANSPLSAELREAITWARQNGVIEMEIAAGRFILKPLAPPQLPTMEDLTTATKQKLAPGGFPADILFAAAPSYAMPGDPEDAKGK